jgi:cold-inducible RNA-binding protein
MATTLYIGNLAFTATTAELESLFSHVGAVESATIITDKVAGESRRFGFVEMGTEQEAETAVARLHGYQLGGRALIVNKARPQGERANGGQGPRW